MHVLCVHEMLTIKDEAGRNRRAVQLMYLECFPHHLTPSQTILVRIRVQHYPREIGTFQAREAVCGVPRTRPTLNFEEEIHHRVEENPPMSSRSIDHDMNGNGCESRPSRMDCKQKIHYIRRDCRSGPHLNLFCVP